MGIFHAFCQVPGTGAAWRGADLDPAPPNWNGSDWIRLHNTGMNSSSSSFITHFVIGGWGQNIYLLIYFRQDYLSQEGGCENVDFTIPNPVLSVEERERQLTPEQQQVCTLALPGGQTLKLLL